MKRIPVNLYTCLICLKNKTILLGVLVGEENSARDRTQGTLPLKQIPSTENYQCLPSTLWNVKEYPPGQADDVSG